MRNVWPTTSGFSLALSICKVAGSWVRDAGDWRSPRRPAPSAAYCAIRRPVTATAAGTCGSIQTKIVFSLRM